jgi:hypothetical protein
VHREYIPKYIQQDATLHNLFISGNSSTCFGWYFHPSSGAHTTVPTASDICHTVTAIGRYRGRVGTGLSVLWVAYATHSTLKPVKPVKPLKQYSTHITKTPTQTHTLQNPHTHKLKQTQYKKYPNEIVTILSNTRSIKSP